MKNIIILILGFLIVGCGVFDKKDLNDEKLLNEDEHVNLNDANGSFDLADYLFPNKNQINQYRIETKNINPNSNEILNQNVVNRIEEFTYIDNKINLGDTTSYLINEKSITKKEFINNFDDIKEYRRYLNKNDVYFSYEEVNIQDDYRQIGKLVCRLVEHNNTKEVLARSYNDVIQLKCIGDFGEGTFNGFAKETFFIIKGFYAKNEGLIESISNRCEYNKYGQTEYTYCTDSIKQIKK